MPRLTKETRDSIKNLKVNELQEIVLKLAASDKTAYDYVFTNYLNKETGEKELMEETKSDLEVLFLKRYKGYADELKTANMLAACIKRINTFTKISKNKQYEAELLLYILEIPFSLSPNMFGTCFTQYDTKVALILKRLINLVTKKMHEDYTIEYQGTINRYLQILHQRSNHIDTIYELPKSI
jgi:YesN/AraC family two-component response regulator